MQGTVEKLTRELHERDEVLADNYDTLQVGGENECNSARGKKGCMGGKG